MRAVMLIEDDAETRTAMAALLNGAGYRVIASDEGRKALELAEATRPSLVVLDLATHGMNGWEFLVRRRDEPALASVPVVVVTGHDRGPPEGADAVFRKPLDAQAFLRAVRALVGEAPRSASPRG